jgi:arylsulfatase A-like enzyme
LTRNILFITTDQQRYDSLGCNGGTIARTPVVDGLAADGINYHRAHNQNVVCMPSRSTMVTGQYARTHGVYANGVPLPEQAPSIASYLHDKARYRTALLGKAHFQPGFDRHRRWIENRMALEGNTGPYRGFEHLELALHTPGFAGFPVQHYGKFLADNYPEEIAGFAPLLQAVPGGDTGAPETTHNPVPREHYHTDWVADRTTAWLDTLDEGERWFCWMSFPDPHHPWDPPSGELGRVNWRDLDLPPGHPGSPEKIVEILSSKPRHWLDWYEGRFPNFEGGPRSFVPCQMTHDQVREINAMTHIENELIDEACGRVLRRIAERGWLRNTDVFFTSDHGELQGDYGLMFKGPYHTDALMRVPLVWRPAPSAGGAHADVSDPVGLLDLAPTFCAIADVPVPEWVQGSVLPTAPGSGRDYVLTEWDSQIRLCGMHMRTIYRDGWICTAYEPTSNDGLWGRADATPVIAYEGTEGELYNVADDPYQWHNRWDDPVCRPLRDDLVADLYEKLPAEREPKLYPEAPT